MYPGLIHGSQRDTVTVKSNWEVDDITIDVQ